MEKVFFFRKNARKAFPLFSSLFNLTLDVTLHSQYGLDGLLMRASFSGGKTEKKRESSVRFFYIFCLRRRVPR